MIRFYFESNRRFADFGVFLAVVLAVVSGATAEVEENPAAMLNSPGDAPRATLGIGPNIAPECRKTAYFKIKKLSKKISLKTWNTKGHNGQAEEKTSEKGQTAHKAAVLLEVETQRNIFQ